MEANPNWHICEPDPQTNTTFCKRANFPFHFIVLQHE